MKSFDPLYTLTLDFSRQCTGNLSVTKKRGSETRNEENSEIEREMGFWTRTKKSRGTPLESLRKSHFIGFNRPFP